MWPTLFNETAILQSFSNNNKTIINNLSLFVLNYCLLCYPNGYYKYVNQFESRVIQVSGYAAQ